MKLGSTGDRAGSSLVPSQGNRNRRRQQQGLRPRQHLTCTAFLGPVATSLPTATTGWLLASAILAAVRLGRKQAEDERLAVLQGRSERKWQVEQQALLRQRAQERERSLQVAELASKRLHKARQRAAEQEKERQAENQRLQEAAAKQREFAERARASERAAYGAKEAELRAELEKRAEVERQIRSEKIAAQRLAEQRQRREQEERRQQADRERQRQEQEMLRQQQLARERKAAERREIQRLSKQFAISLEGTVVFSIPTEGTQTEGRLPRVAILLLETTVGSMIGGSSTLGPTTFASIQEAQEQLIQQLATAALLGAEKYAAAARLQGMMGEGPLTVMSEAELDHWMRSASIRAAVSAAPGVRLQIQQFSDKRAELRYHFEVRSTRGVLPEADSRRTSTILQNIIAAVGSDNLQLASSLLKGFIADEEELTNQDLTGTKVPSFTGAALALAFFLDQMWADRPARRVEASPWYEAASALACSLLAELVAAAPKDSLQEVASLVGAVLPSDHVVARQMHRLAEANLSANTRAQLKQREEALQAEIAERLVETEWPDRAEIVAAKQAEIEAATPLPERIWALRNVGRTSAMGGQSGRFRARQLLDRAVTLKMDFVGSSKHPGMLPEFDALATVLETDPEWEQDAAALRARMLAILASIAELYVRAGDTASAVILLEASVRKYEELLGLRQPDVVAATKRANSLFETLTEDDKAKVVPARRNPDVVKNVICAFEEEVASRQVPGSLHKFESWNETGVQWLGALG